MSALAPSLRAACARWPDRVATVHGGRSLRYGALWDQMLALAGAYRGFGIDTGDRVVCQLPPSPEFLVAAGAAWLCGAVHVGAHKDLTGPELAALVDQTDAAAIVYQPAAGLDEPLAPLRDVRSVRPGIVPIVHGHAIDGADGGHELSPLLSAPPHAPPVGLRSDDPALLLATSGTTGTPKLVVETLAGLWAKVAFFADFVRPGTDDVHLGILPLSHAFGLKLALLALASGGRLVLQDRFSPAVAAGLVAGEGVTVLPGSPAHLTLLLEHLAPLAPPAPPDTLRLAVSAAAPLPPPLIDGLYGRLGVDLFYVYGCSEGFLTATTDPDAVRVGSVGRTVFRGPPGTPPDGTVTVLDPEHDRPLAPGETGEIAYGTAAPVRYWREPDAGTGGWYRTGDLGRRDASGRLYVSGRLKEVVNRGGLKVASGEVEAAIARLPGIADCAVAPTPDPVLGEAICACVVPAGEPPSLAGVRAALAASLARHKLPDELCVVPSIPRSQVGKVDRAGLAALASDGALPRERLREARSAHHDTRR